MRKIRKTVLFISVILCFVASLAIISTAANASSCNHNWVQSDVEGYPCSGYVYQYVCTKCLGLREEKTNPTQNHKWVETYKQAADCTHGGVYQAYCYYCKALDQKETSPLGHSYVYASNNDATCTKDGTSLRTCQRCNDRSFVTDKGSALGHDLSGEWQVTKVPTCKTEGTSRLKCSRCSYAQYRTEPLTSHSDKNKDYKCDVCNIDMSPESSQTPGDDPIIKECSCKCHKGGISGFFWKIGNFFNRLFRIKSKQLCSCGIYHF